MHHCLYLQSAVPQYIVGDSNVEGSYWRLQCTTYDVQGTTVLYGNQFLLLSCV